MATLTGELISETYDSLLKVTDNNTITGVKKRITDGFGNEIPLLLSSTDLEIDGKLILSALGDTEIGTKFLTLKDDNSIAYRSSNEVLRDIGGASSSSISGTTGNLAKFNRSGSVSNSILNERGYAVNLTDGTSSYASFGIVNPGTPGDPGVDNNAYIGSTINNDFLIRVNNVEALRVDTALRLKIANIQNAIVDTDKFLVSDGGVVKYRSGSEVLSDLGITPSNYVTLDTEQTISETKTFTKDIYVNGLRIGRGQGNDSFNTILGFSALQSNTTGQLNTAIGRDSSLSNTTGANNTSVGGKSLKVNTIGSSNSALGVNALESNSTGNNNSSIGTGSLNFNTTGSNNVAVGMDAAKLTSTGGINSISNNSVFIGQNSRPNASNQSNQIVIGYDGIGNGSNSVTIGNSSITDNYFSGNIRGGAFIKSGGTSSQFLKADGSVDSNTYATAGSLSGYVPTSRTLTINGTSYDLSADRYWNVGTVKSVGMVSATSGVTIGSSPVVENGNITLAIATATSLQNGLLSATDWNTFNNKQNTIVNPITGTGTTNYIPVFTSSGAIENSQIQDNLTNVSIGYATNPGVHKLDILGSLRVFSSGGNTNAFITRGSTAVTGLLNFNTDTVNSWQLGLKAIGSADYYIYNGNLANNSLIISNSNNDVSLFGNTSIGYTTNPSLYKLDVNGTGRFSGELLGANNIVSSNANSLTYLQIVNSSTGGKTWTIAGAGASNVHGIATGSFYLRNSYDSINPLTIASTGPATFSSSVTAGGIINNGSNQFTIGGTAINSIYATGPSTFGLSNTDAIYLRRYGVGNYQFQTTADGGNSGNLSLQTYGGKVGIGTASPSFPLDVETGSGRIQLRTGGATGGTGGGNGIASVNSASNALADLNVRANIITLITDATERMRITSGGNVLIGTTSDTGAKLRVEGGVIRSISTYDNTTATAANLVVSAGGTFERSTSSLKYKKEVRDYDKGLDVLMNMRPVYYKGKSENDGDAQFAGLIAEEVHDLGLTEFVQYANDGSPDALAYTHMNALLIKAIQELKAEIDTLKNIN